MAFYLITPADWNRCIRQASTRDKATSQAAIEWPGRDVEVEPASPARLHALQQGGVMLPPGAREVVRLWREGEAAREAKARQRRAAAKKARRAAAKAKAGGTARAKEVPRPVDEWDGVSAPW